MRRLRLFVPLAALALLAFGSLVLAGGGSISTNTISVTLTGAAEVPGPGDPDGDGAVVLLFEPENSRIFYWLFAFDIAPATLAHIHEGRAGVAGPPIVPFTPPTNGSSNGVVTVDQTLLNRILQNPENFYVNVHNADFPDGAIRGQLAR